MLLICLPFSWFWLSAQELKSFSQSLVAVSFFSSNILFWYTTNYFESAAELKPLLHTWSLAVEEQYYLFFPLFIISTWKFGKRWMLTIFLIVSLASLLAAQSNVISNPSTAFYLLHTRIWELILGVFVSFYFFKEKKLKASRLAREVGGIIGLLLIIFSIFMFDSNTPSPSFYTLVPTVGAVLIILYAGRDTSIGIFLSNKILVSIDLISYSSYLWHQPLFAFARLRSAEEPSTVFFPY